MANPTRDETLFLQLVAMFQYAAMQQMGKIPNPMTGTIERDLAQARMSIDMVEMLERRTRAERSDAEKQFLDKVLFELRMNYVEESKNPQPQDAREAPDEVTEGDGSEGE